MHFVQHETLVLDQLSFSLDSTDWVGYPLIQKEAYTPAAHIAVGLPLFSPQAGFTMQTQAVVATGSVQEYLKSQHSTGRYNWGLGQPQPAGAPSAQKPLVCHCIQKHFVLIYLPRVRFISSAQNTPFTIIALEKASVYHPFWKELMWC